MAMNAQTPSVGPPPPLDVEVRQAHAAIRAMTPDALGSVLTLELLPYARQAIGAEIVTDEELRRSGEFDVEERFVPGPPGEPEVRLLICRPAGAPQPMPAIYYIHGGGMVSGHNRMGVMPLLSLAQQLGAAVISVEYRLAPESPHPAPVEDCYAGLTWIAQYAAELGIDPGRLVLVGGSAGGGLAAAVALLSRDRSGPALKGQMLLAPMLDDRNNTPSSRQMENVDIWNRGSNETGWTALLGKARGGPSVSPYAAPARADDLSELPPAYIDVGSAETFRDEDVAYAVRLWQAGSQVELHVWPGGFHGFDDAAPEARISRQAKAARLSWLRSVMAV